MDTGQLARVFRSLCLILMYACHSFSQYSEDTCNWIIWDGADDSRGIRNIRPECAEGNIQWRHPYGAIRIIFTQHHASFQVCFIARSLRTAIKISTESETSLKHVALLTPEAPESDGELCIQSLHGNDVALFVESIWGDTQAVGVLDLDYDIRKSGSPVDTHAPQIENCRPCTDQEIKYTICSADFVAKGTIRHTDDRPNRGETEVHLSLSKIYRQLYPVFTPYSDALTKNNVKKSFQNTEKYAANTLQAFQETVDYKRSSKQSRIPTHSGKVIVPQTCRTKSGTGEFVFMGQIRLKRAHLTCAPRTEDFDRLWMEAKRYGETSCTLE